jgi:hypothetical protein
LPVAAGAPAVGELVGAAGDAGLGADGLQDVGAGVGAGSAAWEEPKIAETSLPKMLMLSSSLVGSARYPRTPAWVHDNGGDPAMFRRGTRWEKQRQDHRGRITENDMIRKLASGGYRLYSRKVDPKTGRRRNLGTFKTRAAAEKHERAVQYFKRH